MIYIYITTQVGKELPSVCLLKVKSYLNNNLALPTHKSVTEISPSRLE